MPDEQYQLLGYVAGTEVGVQPKLDGQDIIVEHNEVGHRLACLLGPGPENAQVFWRGEDLYWRIPHTQRVDRLLIELTNQFIEKGSQVFVEGELKGEASDGSQNPRIWTGNDGEHRASYEVTARTVKFLGRREGNGGAPIGEAPPEGGEDEDVLPF